MQNQAANHKKRIFIDSSYNDGFSVTWVTYSAGCGSSSEIVGVTCSYAFMDNGRTNRALNAQMEIAIPRYRNAFAPEMFSDLNSMLARTAPALPPAPTMPETEPIDFGRINGTTA